MPPTASTRRCRTTYRYRSGGGNVAHNQERTHHQQYARGIDRWEPLVPVHKDYQFTRKQRSANKQRTRAGDELDSTQIDVPEPRPITNR